MKSRVTFVATGIMAFLFLGWTSVSSVSNQDKAKKPWVVPEKSKSVKSPVKGDEAVSAGKASYAKYCKSCHGAKGLGDGPKSKELDTPSGDFSTKEFQSQTEGEMFYKVKEGRDDMPSFKKKISDDEQIWQLVSYIRTLGK